ncbi:E7 [Rousettus aegyptiacus papillomavirus 1]|uniref:Protein E7 n=1 Tax=Rousettus aegyptiacus papillomavirus 1 TaxID=369584 RepID=Q0QII0_9PAPI|nr:E7 [Rousettus aegyptiacus papillomavirus 1]ABC95025.1 E7 [Rousettus aegyptiacus papillomavirus 1]
MRGRDPSLELAAAAEEVQAVDLHCDESLDQEAEQQTFYNIQLPCTSCERHMRLVISCSSSGLRTLAVLLRQREVQLICAQCTREFH